MKNFIAVTTAISIIFFAISCKNGDTTAKVTAMPVAVPLPNTPEDVIKTWQEQVDQNKFAEARLLSTGKALETVVSLDSTNQIKNVAPISSKIINIVCKTNGDKSECDCLLEDSVGPLDCTYLLTRQNGQWYLQDAGCVPAETPKETTSNKKPTTHPVK